jgi:hypothetical protein
LLDCNENEKATNGAKRPRQQAEGEQDGWAGTLIFVAVAAKYLFHGGDSDRGFRRAGGGARYGQGGMRTALAMIVIALVLGAILAYVR